MNMQNRTKTNKNIIASLILILTFTSFSCSKGSSISTESGTQAPSSTPDDPTQPPEPTPTPPPNPVPTPTAKMYGVTVDSVANINDVVNSLNSLSQKATARIVFDEGMAASYYATPIQKIHNVSYVMGEILDSFYVKNVTAAQYLARTQEYYNALSSSVDIWEIGNEINGEWLGNTSDVATKMTSAYDFIKSKGKTTALTLYYNEDCWKYPSEEMFTWANANVPARMKSGLDYVLVSYYEDDCNGLRPNWQQVFAKLAQMFPNSKIGFGEMGTTKSQAAKTDMIQRYYRMNISQDRFVGGYFWWYFVQDMVPSSKPMWQILNNNLL
ncbi:hypothetical protein CIK05_03425 [Bdellovibrio sp. qaytius]|nr:hypothetical protein CIK05_03425 [Bdellovibrio sp. qaytius]